MKLSFSTIACPKWSFDEIFSTAVDFHFDGIEIRGISNEMYAPRVKNFATDEAIKNTLKRLEKANLSISCLASGACLAVYEEKEAALQEGKDYIDLAEKLGVKFVRFMPTGVPQLDGGDIKLCKKAYEELCEYGEAKGVTPLIETNGMFADTAVLKSFIESISSKNKGILWDINHPYRFNGESVEKTMSNIEKYIKYVHVKDSVVLNGMTTYRLLGYGDVPVAQAVKALKKSGYDGFLSLEWVKRWNKNLEEPFVVIPNYAGFMKAILNNL